MEEKLEKVFTKAELKSIEKHLKLGIAADKLYKNADVRELEIAETFYKHLKNGTLDISLYKNLFIFVSRYIYFICRRQTDKQLSNLGFTKQDVRMIRKLHKVEDEYRESKGLCKI